MEDLLWRYPDDFFVKRGHKFTPAAKQFTLSDGGRLDISFRDASERLWVVEVKAAPLRIGVADQVYGYWQRLKESRPNEILFPAVVAPVINSIVEEQLIRWGIESFQISEAEFRRVADERGISIEQAPAVVSGASGRTTVPRQPKEGTMAYEFVPLDPDYEGAVMRYQGRYPDRVWPVHWVSRGVTICDNCSTQTPTSHQLQQHAVYREYPSAADVTCKNCLKQMDKLGIRVSEG